MRAILSLLRRLAGAPGFALAATAVTALGVGSATSLFSVVDAVLLDPLSPEEDRVVVLYRAEIEATASGAESRQPISLLDVNDWRREASSFEALGAFGVSSGVYSAEANGSIPEPRGVAATPFFFDAVGVEPMLGRGFLPEETQPGAENVVVVSYRFWQSALGGVPDVLGQTLELEVNRPFTVVGVMPPGFSFPHQADLWMPARLEPPMDGRYWDFLFVVGKLAPGATTDEARTEIELVDRRLWSETRENARQVRVASASLSDFALGERLRSTMALLAGAVGLLAVVTGTNLLGLCLVRALARRREIAIRAALGAGGLARVGGSLAEVALVCGVGGLLGAFLARSGLVLLIAFGPTDIPRLGQAEFGVDATVFALVMTLGLFLVVAAASAFAASRWSSVAALTASAPGTPGSLRAGKIFTVLQIGATIYLVVGAALLGGSLLRLSREDLGYDTDRLLLFELSRELTLDENANAEAQRRLIRELLPRFEAIPGVRSAGAVTWPPMSGGWPMWFVTETQGFTFVPQAHEGTAGESRTLYVPPEEAWQQSPSVNWQSVSNNYFGVMGISLLEGRAFDESDDEDAPHVVLVGESFAAREWPGESAVGKRMLTYGFRYDANGRAEWQTVVGVVADARYEIDSTSLDVYLPAPQSGWFAPRELVLRTEGEPLAVVSAVRAVVNELDPSARVNRIRTMASVVSRTLLPWRFNAVLVAVLAGASLALATAGVFSLLAQSVSHRTRELGIRLALGATGSSLLRLVLGLGLRLILWGAGLGLGLALATARLLEAHLYGMTPTEPAAYALAILVVASVALLGCSLPAASAARTHPTIALRHEA